MKKSIIIFELILTIVISSIIFATTSKILLQLYDKNKQNYSINMTKLEFETTKLFLLNLLDNNLTLKDLLYTNSTLYYKLNILQGDVTQFKVSQSLEIYNINICIKLSSNICQNWILK
jgi:hypothetical protein